MTEQERYFFDIKGYLVLRNALPADHVAALNAKIDRIEQRPQDELPALAHLGGGEGDDTRINNLAALGGPFAQLIDLEPVVSLAREMMGCRIRLNHAYSIQRYRTDDRTHFHLGNTPVTPACQFRVHDGKFYSTLVKAVYALTDQDVEDGCFSVIAGSHKSNFPNPYGNDPEDIPWREPVASRAGDAIIFTEALTHGSEVNRSGKPRRSLYYAYSPCWATDWKGGFATSPELRAGLTERQRALLEVFPMGTSDSE